MTTMRLRSSTKNQPNESFYVYDRPKRCPTGTRRNQITGKCEKYRTTHSLGSRTSSRASVKSSNRSSVKSTHSSNRNSVKSTHSSNPSSYSSSHSSVPSSTSSFSSVPSSTSSFLSVPSSTSSFSSVPSSVSSTDSTPQHQKLKIPLSIDTKSSHSSSEYHSLQPSESTEYHSLQPSVSTEYHSLPSSKHSSIKTDTSSTKSTPSIHNSSIYPSISSIFSYSMPQPKPSPKPKIPLTIDTNVPPISPSIPSVSTISQSSSHSPPMRFSSIYSSPSSKFSFSMPRPKLSPKKNKTPPKLISPHNLRPRPIETVQALDTTPPILNKKRCPNGSRRNKTTGECDKNTKPNTENPTITDKPKRCPNGSRRNKTTGNCDKITLKRCPNGTRRNQKTGKCEPSLSTK